MGKLILKGVRKNCFIAFYFQIFTVVVPNQFSKQERIITQNHSTLYQSSCLNCEGIEIINPNKWSADGTIALRGTHFSNNGKYLGFGKSSSGSDWKEFLIMDLATKEIIDDNLKDGDIHRDGSMSVYVHDEQGNMVEKITYRDVNENKSK